MCEKKEQRCKECNSILTEKNKCIPSTTIKTLSAQTPITQSIVSSTSTSSPATTTTLYPLENREPKLLSRIEVYICPKCGHENQIVEIIKTKPL